MGILLTLILGGLAGFIASKIMKTDAQMGVVANVVVGILGAFIANVLLTPLFGLEASLTTITLEGFLMAVLGSIALLALVNLFTRRSIR